MENYLEYINELARIGKYNPTVNYEVDSLQDLYNMCHGNENELIELLDQIAVNKIIKCKDETIECKEIYLKRFWKNKVNLLVIVVKKGGGEWIMPVGEKLIFSVKPSVSSPLDPYGEEAWDD